MSSPEGLAAVKAFIPQKATSFEPIKHNMEKTGFLSEPSGKNHKKTGFRWEPSKYNKKRGFPSEPSLEVG